MSSGSSGEGGLGFPEDNHAEGENLGDGDSSQFFSVKSNHSQISEAAVAVERLSEVEHQDFETDSELVPRQPGHRNQSSMALPYLKQTDFQV